MISFVVIVGRELRQHPAQVGLPEEYQAVPPLCHTAYHSTAKK
jgi:hypothetical protein